MARWYEAAATRCWPATGGCREGELDLVVARDGVVVFCEVKSRSSDAFGQPFEAVTPTKQTRLRRLAARWLAADGRSWPVVRFDVASVVRGRVVGVIESAF